MRIQWAKYWCYRAADNNLCRPADGKKPGTWRRFSLRELHAATNNFNYDNKLGEGTIGSVYWGQLASGDQIAVKRLKVWSTKAEREFAVEIEILGRVRHKNLLSLLGYCAEGQERLIVYEYMPNLSLYSHLHGHLAADSALDWDQRMKIAVGSAEGLAYLHHYATPQIVHRGIKASNILMDENLNALVADFGLAKLIPNSSAQKGISGCTAPKTVAGKVTEACDVYSFGVLLMELISGRKPIERVSGEKQAIMNWARPLILQGKIHDLVDAKLEGKFDKDHLNKLAQVAALCAEILPEERPSMQDVVEMLKEGTKDLMKPLLQDGDRFDEAAVNSVHPVGIDVNTLNIN
ncbi:PTI1-like tyrosine-protein kinase At3g15890 isoform X2 [Physcomitrium patens]|uniref:non-specific serine/threonine protein kinase n=1 Tax=Physcomitrium patens TaxID=3218 RepID=A0A2K1KG47_PHYPA|nr:PTI1-like tyrosine-protein kinase At3g15890 isoform X2 [Physcomitrium patens]PNR52757.1 hypothetical protein PHYPA_009132 [Physcomitrium patens]|eukprot:XP_024377339.1 PTI1-like tyrosine-protein kinase At3g15890 isoform X2 [Physcomitrella patens]